MYGPQQISQIGEGNTGQFNIACLNRVDRMCNRKEEGEIEKYFIAFKYALFFVIAAITKETRNKILSDFKILEDEIKKIEESKENDKSKEDQILALRYDFADKHEYHIFEAFSKVGILNIGDDGVLDFEKHDINQLKSVARADAGPAKIKEVSDAENATIKKG